MATDSYTKFVLSVVAVCLLLLVAQGFGWGSARPTDASSGDRYRMAVIPLGRFVLRMNGATGEAWKLSLPKADGWVRVPDSEELPQANEQAPPTQTPEGPDER